LEDNYAPFLIPIELPQDVILIERALLAIRRHLQHRIPHLYLFFSLPLLPLGLRRLPSHDLLLKPLLIFPPLSIFYSFNLRLFLLPPSILLLALHAVLFVSKFKLCLTLLPLKLLTLTVVFLEHLTLQTVLILFSPPQTLSF
jgi:hypothetical protein